MTADHTLATWSHRVRAEDMRPLADILRDPNPIHLDPSAAAAAGLGDRVINQGPANLAYIVNLLAKAFPSYRLAGLQSRFLAAVRHGDMVEAGGRILSREADAIECELWLDVAGAGRAVAAKARLVPRT